jgi:hypothetical protein
MKIMPVILLNFVIPAWLFAQNQVQTSSDDSLDLKRPTKIDKEEIAGYLAQKKPHISVTSGTMLLTGFGNGGYFGTYLAPDLSYPLTGKLKIHTGLMIANYFGDGFFYPLSEGTYGYSTGNFTRRLIYAGGSYDINSKLTLSGTVYKEFNLFNSNPSSPEKNNFDYKGMIMGIDYKIGKNAVISGQIEISDSPYSRHLYMNSYPGSGFGTNSIFQPYPY